MTLGIPEAEAILRSRFGEPAKPPTDYVIGFGTPSGKVLAIHREATETRIWFQSPAPPTLTYFDWYRLSRLRVTTRSPSLESTGVCRNAPEFGRVQIFR